MMGFPRETFYRYHRARDEGGIEALLDKNRESLILKIVWMRVLRRQSKNFLLNFSFLDRFEQAMNSVEEAYFFLPVASVLFGSVMGLAA